MKIRSIWFGMLIGLCIDNAEAAEKRLDEGWTTQIFNRLVLCLDQSLGQVADYPKNNSLKELENLTQKRDQLEREIRDQAMYYGISLKDIPCEALYNVAAQQEENRKKTNEYNRLTFQIAQKMDISGDTLKHEAQAGKKEERKS